MFLLNLFVWGLFGFVFLSGCLLLTRFMKVSESNRKLIKELAKEMWILLIWVWPIILVVTFAFFITHICDPFIKRFVNYLMENDNE